MLWTTNLASAGMVHRCGRRIIFPLPVAATTPGLLGPCLHPVHTIESRVGVTLPQGLYAGHAVHFM